MKNHIDYKVLNGKLLRIDFDLENNTIKNIRITGDFFIHPEESIKVIENSLKNIRINEIEKKLNETISKNKIKIVGFNGKDLEKALKQQ
jgi:hypothetical protein